MTYNDLIRSEYLRLKPQFEPEQEPSFEQMKAKIEAWKQAHEDKIFMANNLEVEQEAYNLIIQTAIQEGKIHPTQAQHYRDALNKRYDETMKILNSLPTNEKADPLLHYIQTDFDIIPNTNKG